ncbi:CapA family protein [Lentzea sp. NBC_00516]|uniref:CapA family protein n=1 Tax=Lentzea sp. NBC_00516 TaxID=2903582 RepID=UPI002E7FD2C3|nr:CapA family protein [Lentzea sp. NBC_00516]WUD26868.1 CapA family protein [Lentzea sp. NBC_00516]
MRIVLVGDLMVSHSLRDEPAASALSAVRGLLARADAGFANFESVAHDFQWPPMTPSGGSWARTPPEVCAELRELGVSLVSVANNHAGDYGPAAFASSLATLSAAGLVYAGGGQDGVTAAAPAVLRTSAGSIGLVAATATCPAHAVATRSCGAVPARYGVNTLRRKGSYQVPGRHLAALSDVSAEFFGSGGEDRVVFGGVAFERGDSFHREESVDENSLNVLLDAVRKVRSESRVVLVSVHCHARERDPHTPPAFLVGACRALVDAGADVVVAHGPHVARPVEIYRGRLICYGLGSLLLRPDDAAQPAEVYAAHGLRPGDGPGLTARRLRGLAAGGEDCSALVVDATVEGGALRRVDVHPVLLDTDPGSPSAGLPRRLSAAESDLVLERSGVARLDVPRGLVVAGVSASPRG